MLDEILVAAIAIIVIAGGSGGFWLLRGRKRSARTGGRPPLLGRRKDGVSTDAEDGAATFDRMRAAIQELLHGVSSSINGLLGDTTKYDSSLDKHRTSLEKMATIEDLQDLERVLLNEVKEVQTANEQYRRQLDDANAKVSVQQEELDLLQSAVGVDFLTEIPNRRALDERMEEMMSRAERYGNTFSLIVFDIDHFKAINDKHGHAGGDRILRAIAHLLNDHKRSSDFLARFGGEEFVLLLPETTLESAQRLAEKTRERVDASNFRFQKERVRVTLSAGVGELHPGRDTAEALFKRVDAALYLAKQEGRNRVNVAETPAPAE